MPSHVLCLSFEPFEFFLLGVCVYEEVHPSSCATESDGVSILLSRLQKKIAPISDQGNKEVASPFVHLFGPLAACLDTQGAGISRPASHATSGLAFLWALGARGGLAAGSELSAVWDLHLGPGA